MYVFMGYDTKWIYLAVPEWEVDVVSSMRVNEFYRVPLFLSIYAF